MNKGTARNIEKCMECIVVITGKDLEAEVSDKVSEEGAGRYTY
jgi:hypothetical protein